MGGAQSGRSPEWEEPREEGAWNGMTPEWEGPMGSIPVNDEGCWDLSTFRDFHKNFTNDFPSTLPSICPLFKYLTY